MIDYRPSSQYTGMILPRIWGGTPRFCPLANKDHSRIETRFFKDNGKS